MHSDPRIRFRCIEVAQPIGTYYVGAVPASDLAAIAYADIRRIEQRDIEVMSGIQRELQPTRVKEIYEYAHTVDAAFPTSVILAVAHPDVEFDASRGEMSIRRDAAVAKIIDGQHRIAGLKDYVGVPFQLNVVVFVDMELEDQAMVFATINLKQTKVTKSLAYDLFDYATTRSPQKTAHDVARFLNSRAGSPLEGKIKILGVASGDERESLTQATFVDRLMLMMSTAPMKDRDTIKRKRQVRLDGTELGRGLVFRKMFVEARDGDIARCVWSFFTAVGERWPRAWRARQAGNILNRTNGFGALMRVLGKVCRREEFYDRVFDSKPIYDMLKRVKLEDSDFTPERFKPGSSGEAELVRILEREIGL